MTKRFTHTLAAAIVGIAWLSASPDGQAATPLPSFAAVSAAGAVVTSDRLSAAERWVLVYVVPGSVAGDRLLRALDAWAGADGARIVVVISGPATVIETSVRPLLAKSSPTIAIYADPDGSAARALAVTSSAAFVGVARSAVDWIIQGVLNDPQLVEPVVRSWLGQP